MKNTPINVTKSSGQIIQYSEPKLIRSLTRSGASPSTIEEVLIKLKPRLFDGMRTKEIYKMAYGLLKKHQTPVAARYKLRQAIMELGPSGFPFEKFVGEIFKRMGYEVKVGVILQGKCVSHEVDVVATRNQEVNFVECKYHNSQVNTSDVKVTLYIHARFMDLENQMQLENKAHQKFNGWVVTNTDFTKDAITYASCVGLKLLSWNYPEKQSLRELIDRQGLYPVTCLTSLTKNEKQQLIDKNIVLCRELCEKPQLIDGLAVSGTRLRSFQHELKELTAEDYQNCKL